MSKFKMAIRILQALCLIGSAYAGSTFAADGVTLSIADQQKEKVASLLSQVNVQTTTVASQVISVPLDAATGGCLDGITGSIDLTRFKVGLPAIPSLWDVIYIEIKDEIMKYACNAANGWIQAQAAALSQSLSAPGFMSVSISQGSAQSDWQSVAAADVKMSPVELSLKVTTGNLGLIPGPLIPSGVPTKIETSKEAPTTDSEIWDEKLGEHMNTKALWGED